MYCFYVVTLSIGDQSKPMFVSISFIKFCVDYLKRIVIYFYKLASEARVGPDNLDINGPVTWLGTIEF